MFSMPPVGQTRSFAATGRLFLIAATVPILLFAACTWYTRISDAVVIETAGDGRAFQTTAVLTVTVTDTPGWMIDGFHLRFVPESGTGTLRLLPEGDHKGVEYSMSFPGSVADTGETGFSDATIAGDTWVSYTQESYVRRWVYHVTLESDRVASVRVIAEATLADQGCVTAEDGDVGIAITMTDEVAGPIQ